MAMADDAALRNLSQFVNIMSNQGLQQSPEKLAGLEDIMQNVVSTMPQLVGMPELLMTQSDSSSKPAASSSSGSTSPHDETMDDTETNTESSAPTASVLPRVYRMEPWHECFNTTKEAEFQALIYSVYVIARDDRKLDGYEYYECINRLQNKCRYKVRAKKVSEFFIVEEKGAHNHAMEPVGSPGSHAGLPKTLREIVDSSFNNDWSNVVRQQKIEEEVKRLGLPHNPRLGRQIDNRIAYLRRVKNLAEMRKIQDQMPGMPMSTSAPTMAQHPSMPPTCSNPEEILRLVMQQVPVEVKEELVPQPMPQQAAAQTVMPQQPLVIHDNNNELMNIIMQAGKEGMHDQSQILQMLVQNGMMPPMPQQPQHDSSCSTPEGRLEIED